MFKTSDLMPPMMLKANQISQYFSPTNQISLVADVELTRTVTLLLWNQ